MSEKYEDLMDELSGVDINSVDAEAIITKLLKKPMIEKQAKAFYQYATSSNLKSEELLAKIKDKWATIEMLSRTA